MITIDEDKNLLKSDILTDKVDYNKRIRPRQTLTMAIIGDKGSGKTLFMAIMGVIYNYLGKEFYTNFYMSEEITHRHEFNIRNLYFNPNVEGIFLDEAHNIADQNSNQTLETQLLVALFTQSRKRNQLILLSTLRFYKLAKDLRNLTNVIVYPYYDIEKDKLYLQFWDFRNETTTEFIVKNSSRFFKFYDTYEIVVSEKIKTQLAQFLLKHQRLKKEINKDLENHEKQLLSEINERLRNEL